MTVNQMRRSLKSHKMWFTSYAQQLQGHADLYSGTGLNAAGAAMHVTLAKFRAKGAFLEKAYRQLICLDPSHKTDYDSDNKALLESLQQGHVDTEEVRTICDQERRRQEGKNCQVRPELRPTKQQWWNSGIGS